MSDSNMYHQRPCSATASMPPLRASEAIVSDDSWPLTDYRPRRVKNMLKMNIILAAHLCDTYRTYFRPNIACPVSCVLLKSRRSRHAPEILHPAGAGSRSDLGHDRIRS